jgi:hypothetical protein
VEESVELLLEFLAARRLAGPPVAVP